MLLSAMLDVAPVLDVAPMLEAAPMLDVAPVPRLMTAATTGGREPAAQSDSIVAGLASSGCLIK
jgi:hypothetical protein